MFFYTVIYKALNLEYFYDNKNVRGNYDSKYIEYFYIPDYIFIIFIFENE